MMGVFLQEANPARIGRSQKWYTGSLSERQGGKSLWLIGKFTYCLGKNELPSTVTCPSAGQKILIKMVTPMVAFALLRQPSPISPFILFAFLVFRSLHPELWPG